MNNKSQKPFDKKSSKKVPFEEILKLINTNCEYKFSIIDTEIDDELLELAANYGIDLSGFKHVIETSGIIHSYKRHGNSSNDRQNLSIDDYLLIPYIIRNRDTVKIPESLEKSHNNRVIIYEKEIGEFYYYVEEIRKGKKSLTFKTLYKRIKNPSI